MGLKLCFCNASRRKLVETETYFYSVIVNMKIQISCQVLVNNFIIEEFHCFSLRLAVKVGNLTSCVFFYNKREYLTSYGVKKALSKSDSLDQEIYIINLTT